MAIYGFDLYGRSKYGGKILVDFGVEPFIADARSFSTAMLTWSEPSGAWQEFRLIRNRTGYAINEDDGEIIYKTESYTGGASGLLDTGLTGGWVYYTIFLLDEVSGQWQKAAVADTLVPYDYGSDDTLWDLVPEHYKILRETGAGYSQALYNNNPAIYLSNQETVSNNHLAKFLTVLGWGTNILRSQIDTTLDGYDPNTMHMSRLAMLANQLGTDIEQTVPAQTNRNLVSNLGRLYRKRGTLSGIKELLALKTGWDFDISLGSNIMLSEDQANFINPAVQNWDQGSRYETGDRIRYNNWYYQALKTAYGASQAPPIDGSNNEWWSHDNYIDTLADTTTVDPYNNSVAAGWQIRTSDGASIPGGIAIGVGAVDPVDGDIFNSNSLFFLNNLATVNSIVVKNVPSTATGYDREMVIKSAIPTPPVYDKYVTGRTYEIGDTVMWRGAPFEALTTTTDNPSTADADHGQTWKRLGTDRRVQVGISFWAHGPFNGTPGTGGVPVTPLFITFDEHGDLMQELFITPANYSATFLDAFNTPGALMAGREMDIGSTLWSTVPSPWAQGWDDESGYMYPNVSGRTFAVVNTNSASGNVSITYRGVGSREMGVIFRYSSGPNFWVATQTGLFKVVAGGALTNPASGALSWPACVPGDRLSVQFTGSTLSVSINGAVVGTATDSFNSTATSHGVDAES